MIREERQWPIEGNIPAATEAGGAIIGDARGGGGGAGWSGSLRNTEPIIGPNTDVQGGAVPGRVPIDVGRGSVGLQIPATRSPVGIDPRAPVGAVSAGGSENAFTSGGRGVQLISPEFAEAYGLNTIQRDPAGVYHNNGPAGMVGGRPAYLAAVPDSARTATDWDAVSREVSQNIANRAAREQAGWAAQDARWGAQEARDRMAQITSALETGLRDPDRLVRAAAFKALEGMGVPYSSYAASARDYNRYIGDQAKDQGAYTTGMENAAINNRKAMSEMFLNQLLGEKARIETMKTGKEMSAVPTSFEESHKARLAEIAAGHPQPDKSDSAWKGLSTIIAGYRNPITGEMDSQALERDMPLIIRSMQKAGLMLPGMTGSPEQLSGAAGAGYNTESFNDLTREELMQGHKVMVHKKTGRKVVVDKDGYVIRG